MEMRGERDTGRRKRGETGMRGRKGGGERETGRRKRGERDGRGTRRGIGREGRGERGMGEVQGGE